MSFSAFGCGPFRFDGDGSLFACCVVVIAAPLVEFGCRDEASGDWVAVDVLDFLAELLGCPDVEVVVARLPEVVAFSFKFAG